MKTLTERMSVYMRDGSQFESYVRSQLDEN